MPFTYLLVVYFGPFSLSFSGSFMWPFTSYNKTGRELVTNISIFFRKIPHENAVYLFQYLFKSNKKPAGVPAGFGLNG